ncbi:MAG: hypothetical protein V2A61_06480 [Calditrichota bacterium]
MDIDLEGGLQPALQDGLAALAIMGPTTSGRDESRRYRSSRTQNIQ